MLECLSAQPVSSDVVEPKALAQTVKLSCSLHVVASIPVLARMGPTSKAHLFPRQTAFNQQDALSTCQNECRAEVSVSL